MAINATFIDSTSFTVITDRTIEFNVGRRVRADCGVDGYKYLTIGSSAFITLTTIITDPTRSDDLTSNLSTVKYGAVKAGATGNQEDHFHTLFEGDGGFIAWAGTSGTSGSSGDSGTSGTSGSSGDSGTSGSSGTSGIDGTSGSSGTSGATGTSGSSGTSGIDGTSGSSGTSGIDGTSGSSGTSGADGTSGSSGTSGDSGTSGTSGIDGTSGTSGTSGATGTSGSSGTSGATGTSGTSGIDGTSGTSGVDGTSGSSGSSGTSGVGYLHTQAGASAIWNVTHNMGMQYVNVEVIDSNDKVMIPLDIEFTDTTSLIITLSSAESGHAAITMGGGSAGTSGTSGASGTSGTSGTSGVVGGGTDNTIARYDGVNAIQDSGVTLDDNDNISGVNKLTVDSINTDMTVDTQYGIYTDYSIKPPSDQAINTKRRGIGSYTSIPIDSTANVHEIMGVIGMVENYGSGDVTQMYALNGWAYNYGAGHIGHLSGGWMGVQNDNGSIGELKVLELVGYGGGSSITSMYGLKVGALNAWAASVTNRYGVYIAAFTGVVTNDYAIYQAGASQKNYLAGSLKVGTGAEINEFSDDSTSTLSTQLLTANAIQQAISDATLAGTSGTSGTSGVNGTSGTSGDSGTSGTSGIDGTSGSSGDSGTSGSSGTSGATGDSGTSGSSGISGTSGSSGDSGTSGTSGANGTSGTSGANGTSGTSGVNGTSGTSGVAGTSGTSGDAGAAGTSGTSGTSGAGGGGGEIAAATDNDIAIYASDSTSIEGSDYSIDGQTLYRDDVVFNSLLNASYPNCLAIGPVGTPATNKDKSILIGNMAGDDAYTLSSVLIGDYAGRHNGNGNNVVVGCEAGYCDGNSYYNVAIGYQSGLREGSGIQSCVHIGTWTGTYGAGSNESVVIGSTACRRPAVDSVFIGVACGGSTAGTRQFDVAMGYRAAYSITSGEYDTLLGYKAGYSITTGDKNVALGSEAGYSNQTGDANVFIGYKAGYNETGSDKLYIGNNATESLIEGDFSAKTLKFNTDSTAADAFEVTSGMQFDGDLSPDGGVSTGYTGDLKDSTGTKIATVVNGIITAVDF